MKKRWNTRYIFLLVLSSLLIATLACAGGASDEDIPGGDEDPADAPDQVDEEPPTELPPTATPEPTATPPPPGITTANAGSLSIQKAIIADDSQVLAADYSPIANQVATFGGDRIVRIFDSETGQIIHEMEGHAQSGWALAYSPDGMLLASGGGDFRIRIWDVQTGEEVNVFIVNADPYRVIWAPGGSRIGVVGAGSAWFELFDPLTGEKITTLKPSEYVLWSAAYSPDGSKIATADNRGVVTVFDADSFQPIVMDNETAVGAGWDIEFSPDGSLIGSCHDGGGVYVWDSTDLFPLLSGVVYEEDCVDGAFSQNSDIYFTGGDNGWIYAWDTESGDNLGEIQMPDFLWTLSLSGDNERLAAALNDGTVVLIGPE